MLGAGAPVAMTATASSYRHLQAIVRMHTVHATNTGHIPVPTWGGCAGPPHCRGFATPAAPASRASL
eukprot:scaffold11391_cov125-Isochrysis_galbana.AAC.10